jgi:hypothetical protein
MRTWELNTYEFLKLVEETGVAQLVVRPTPDMVGRPAIARILQDADTDPLQIADLGRLLYVSEDGVKVELKGTKKGEMHEDGEEGEVFLQTYTSRRKFKSDTLAGRCVCVCVCVCACVSGRESECVSV